MADYLLAHPCEDCGISDIRVLEFDHRERKARRNDAVSVLVYRQASVERLRAEIAKCRILCANCHRIRTHAQLGWKARLEDPQTPLDSLPLAA